MQDNFPRPIPVPVTALRPIRANCEQCHWPANFFGRTRGAVSALPLRRAEHALGDRHAGAGRRRRAAEPSQMGIHWHVASKVEYVATDPERQNIVWVRAVNPQTGVANVYTSQPQKTTAPPAGEIRTMDCVDCHNRPSHILHAPDRSVDATLPMAGSTRLFRLSSSRASQRWRQPTPIVSRRCGASTARSAATIRRTIRRSTPPSTRRSRPRSQSPAGLQPDYFFPAMKVRWNTYYSNEGHFHFLGCFRCHDGQHKSVDGNAIRSDCSTCHRFWDRAKPAACNSPRGRRG